MTTTAQEIAERLAETMLPRKHSGGSWQDRFEGMERDHQIQSRANILLDAGLREAVEEMEALIELCDVPGPIEKHNLKRWFAKALARLKGEKA